MSDLTNEQLDGMAMWDRDIMLAPEHCAAGALLVRMAVDEIRRRRAADESTAIDKAVADAAIALDQARDARAAAQWRYFRETEHGTPEHDLAWISLKAAGDKLSALEVANQRAINVAVTYRRDPSLVGVVAALSKLGDDDVAHIVASPPDKDG